MLQRDLRLAKRLGFRFVRPKIGVVSSDLVPDPIWTESVERSLDLAAELDVVICPEIHSPTPIKHEVVDDYIDLIERTGTKHFGLLLDTGIFQDRPIPLRPGELPGQRPAFLDGIGVDPADIADIAKYVVFIQAKFHDIDERPRGPADPVGARAPGAEGRRVHRLPLQRVRGRARSPGARSSRCDASTP